MKRGNRTESTQTKCNKFLNGNFTRRVNALTLKKFIIIMHYIALNMKIVTLCCVDKIYNFFSNLR